MDYRILILVALMAGRTLARSQEENLHDSPSMLVDRIQMQQFNNLCGEAGCTITLDPDVEGLTGESRIINELNNKLPSYSQGYFLTGLSKCNASEGTDRAPDLVLTIEGKNISLNHDMYGTEVSTLPGWLSPLLPLDCYRKSLLVVDPNAAPNELRAGREMFSSIVLTIIGQTSNENQEFEAAIRLMMKTSTLVNEIQMKDSGNLCGEDGCTITFDPEVEGLRGESRIINELNSKLPANYNATALNTGYFSTGVLFCPPFRRAPNLEITIGQKKISIDYDKYGARVPLVPDWFNPILPNVSILCIRKSLLEVSENALPNQLRAGRRIYSLLL